jgi:hypothetical protein
VAKEGNWQHNILLRKNSHKMAKIRHPKNGRTRDANIISGSYY